MRLEEQDLKRRIGICESLMWETKMYLPFERIRGKINYLWDEQEEDKEGKEGCLRC